VRLEVLSQLENPMTPSEIETAIFRFVALCLNQLHYRMPHTPGDIDPGLHCIEGWVGPRARMNKMKASLPTFESYVSNCLE
jgi:hypothetical protein